MSTKFMVIQLKQLIKTALFIVAGIALIFLLIYFAFPKGTSTAKSIYEPGVYTASILLKEKPIEVSVTVSKSKIEKIELADMSETVETFYPLIKPTMETITKEVVKTQSLDVRFPADSATTGQILMDGIESALAKAVIQ